jgi:hypothetical protein
VPVVALLLVIPIVCPVAMEPLMSVILTPQVPVLGKAIVENEHLVFPSPVAGITKLPSLKGSN